MASMNPDVIATEEMPCDTCPFRADCAVDEISCHAFAEYVSGRQWRGVERDPNEWWYLATMTSDDHMLRNLKALERNDAAA